MSCLVIVEFLCKQGRSEEFIDMCRRNYPVTRAYDGCKYDFLSVDKDDENSLVMVEEWDSKEHHQNYVAFRETDGTSDFMDPLLTCAPTVRYLDITDA